MVRILVKDEDHVTSLCAYHHPACANLELGDLMVVDALDVNGSAECIVGDQSHVVACNTAVSTSAD